MTTNSTKPGKSVIQWLLDSDPSIRWQALRDLQHAPAAEVAVERAKVATEGWGATLLAADPAAESAGGRGLEYGQALPGATAPRRVSSPRAGRTPSATAHSPPAPVAAPGQRRLAARHPACPAHFAALPQHPVGRDTDLLALDLQLPFIFQVKISRDAFLGLAADVNFTPSRLRHEARSHIDIIPHQSVFLAQIRRTGIPGKKLPGVDTDALAETIDARSRL